MFKRFEKTSGISPEIIKGQKRFLYSLSLSDDLYDVPFFLERGPYQGMTISFHDLEEGKVYTPFEKKENVIYDRPVYDKGRFCFLQGDFNDRVIRMISWTPESGPETVTELPVADTGLYNLHIVGKDLHIISSDSERMVSYWPERFSIALDPHESVEFIEKDCICLSSWVEEGWDETNSCASEDYRYYERTIIKDKKGNVISVEDASPYQDIDGNWWLV